MTIRDQFIEEALLLLEEGGPEGLTSRAVCTRVGVKAPTLYHHFGDLGGLHDAAVSAGFERFLAHKQSQKPFADPGEDLLAGWDNYIAFARAHPKLYRAMAAKYATGQSFLAAQQSREILDRKLEALAAAGRLNVPPLAAAEITWSSAHAAATLIISLYPNEPTTAAITALRASVEHLLRPVV
ncbi:TetR/AcrR family transcriptional regulator [Phyllobacterium sp. YR531]|uniref:TetR/AcrR family transcriptional regulator n=1 Tax=Phyllobacterium sp. YR531 TaxID=1144343 RepID=UPI00026FBB3F|nr:TetR/AcrR family transcriptional regulator [Phyllobacterium sp. YR531]EJN02344.1 transcriptional regulator [Phyllobacterium sp. YR531]